jgi:hypothetical protein
MYLYRNSSSIRESKKKEYKERRKREMSEPGIDLPATEKRGF